MKKFHFKYETVDKVRKGREKEAMRLLGLAQRILEDAKNRKLALEEDLRQSYARRQEFCEKADTVSPLQMEDDFIEGTKIRITQAGQAIQRASRGVEKVMKIYLHARKQVKVMDILREKHFAEYKKDVSKREQRSLDDLYVMRDRLRRVGT